MLSAVLIALCDTCLIQRLRIAADDPSYSFAARLDAIALERCCDVGHVAVQAVLREQCAGDRGEQDEAEGQVAQDEADERGDDADYGKQDENCNNALGALCGR